MYIKLWAFLKSVIPSRARRLLRRAKYKFLGLEKSYDGMEANDIFDQIYKNGVWGKDGAGKGTSGAGSHNSNFVQPYINVVLREIKAGQCETIADLGCGDFNVGYHFIGICKKLYACDVSGVILDQNRQKYIFPNLHFLHLDLAKDQLPVADIAFTRQVLQHLNNADILAFVRKVNEVKPFKYLIVTEDLPSFPDFLPNQNKPSGPNTRTVVDSGVVLHEKPFNLQFKAKKTLLEVSQKPYQNDVIIKTILYKF